MNGNVLVIMLILRLNNNFVIVVVIEINIFIRCVFCKECGVKVDFVLIVIIFFC